MSKISNAKANQIRAPFVLPELPYDKQALMPHMSAETFNFHHGKHHKAYVDNLNKLIDSTELANKSLEEIIISTFNKEDQKSIFNNAAQVWNHSFFWHCLKPKGGGQPQGKLADQIKKDFGSYDKFKEEFKNAGSTQFGSGWAWLVFDGSKLSVIKTPNAELPLTKQQTAILTADVWEHAYYLDYQNRRVDYLDIFLNELVNWQFAEENFGL